MEGYDLAEAAERSGPMTTAMIGRDAELAAILAFLRRSPAAPRAR